MEELIFIAVIIFFSIIESIARSRKKRAAGTPRVPDEWEPEETGREWSRESTAATYDAEPSYDALETDEAADPRETLPEYTRPRGTLSGTRTAQRSGSQGMIPDDVWEEIAGLARGKAGQLETKPEPRAQTPPPRPSTSPSRLGWGTRTPKVGQQHRVHLAHAGYGTDPSSRAPSLEDGLDPLARRPNADVRAVRKQLRRGRHALRQAVVLQEVLGPPASMRPEAFLE